MQTKDDTEGCESWKAAQDFLLNANVEFAFRSMFDLG
jgi:hypothetical protein